MARGDLTMYLKFWVERSGNHPVVMMNTNNGLILRLGPKQVGDGPTMAEQVVAVFIQIGDDLRGSIATIDRLIVISIVKE